MEGVEKMEGREIVLRDQFMFRRKNDGVIENMRGLKV